MKRFISVVLSGVMLASVFLCSCNLKPKETDEETESEVSEVSEAQDDEKPDKNSSGSKLDQAKYDEVLELYKKKVPDSKFAVQVFADGIRGEGSYHVSENQLSFYYDADEGRARFNLTYLHDSNRLLFDIDMSYGDTRYYLNSGDNLAFDAIETYISDAAELKTGKYCLYDDSAAGAYSEQIKNDLPLYYARMIALAEKAFPELGFGLEDIGFKLGDKYRTVDPTQASSTEPVIKNEHKFENGVCKDCGMPWTEYFYDTLEKMDPHSKPGEWHSIYGQDNDLMLEPSDYVQLSSSDKNSAEIYYQHIDDKWHTETCRIYITERNGKLLIGIRFNYTEGMHSTGRGTVADKFTYWFRVEAEPGEFAKIFESKESFVKNFEMYLFVEDEDGTGHDVWSSKSDEEIKKLFDEVEDCVYYTKDEMIDLFWNEHERIFNCMDKAMFWMGTSLSDAGINWKKEN